MFLFLNQVYLRALISIIRIIVNQHRIIKEINQEMKDRLQARSLKDLIHVVDFTKNSPMNKLLEKKNH